MQNVYVHFNVEERGKVPGQLGLAPELYVMEGENKYSEPFSDLDEICSRYIDPMNELVAEVVKDKRYHPGSREEVERHMKEALASHPNTAQYRMRTSGQPGRCVLVWWWGGVGGWGACRGIVFVVASIHSSLFLRPASPVVPASR